MNINILETVGLLTRCSFDERYREPIISLGGVQTLAEFLLVSGEKDKLKYKWCDPSNCHFTQFELCIEMHLLCLLAISFNEYIQQD